MIQLIQEPGLTEREKDHFLSQFSVQNEKSLVAFAVMGGIFGEGIDLCGDRLTGVAVVGVGLPGMSAERDVIRDYYDESEQRGYQYAYQYPGMTRVLQAAGRVIRTETDKGVVLLVDDRFSSPSYRALLPVSWRPQFFHDQDLLQMNLTEFWQTGSHNPGGVNMVNQIAFPLPPPEVVIPAGAQRKAGLQGDEPACCGEINHSEV
jgi:DNA excision repair protein ERCC-2